MMLRTQGLEEGQQSALLSPMC